MKNTVNTELHRGGRSHPPMSLRHLLTILQIRVIMFYFSFAIFFYFFSFLYAVYQFCYIFRL